MASVGTRPYPSTNPLPNTLPNPQHATDDQAFLDSWESLPPCAPAPTAAVAAPSFNLTVSVGGPKHPGRTVPRKLGVYSGGPGNITCNTNPLPNPQHATDDDQAFLDSLESPPPCAPAPATTPFYTPMVPKTPLSDELDTLLKVCGGGGARCTAMPRGHGFARNGQGRGAALVGHATALRTGEALHGGCTGTGKGAALHGGCTGPRGGGMPRLCTGKGAALHGAARGLHGGCTGLHGAQGGGHATALGKAWVG